MKVRGLDRLAKVAAALRDRDLAALRAAGAAREGTRALIAALETAAEVPADDPGAQVNALRYRLWAEARRRELNMALARQTAEWLGCRDAAAQSFGRAAALDRIIAAAAPRRRGG